jgi:hypothetical protein
MPDPWYHLKWNVAEVYCANQAGNGSDNPCYHTDLDDFQRRRAVRAASNEKRIIMPHCRTLCGCTVDATVAGTHDTYGLSVSEAATGP